MGWAAHLLALGIQENTVFLSYNSHHHTFNDAFIWLLDLPTFHYTILTWKNALSVVQGTQEFLMQVLLFTYISRMTAQLCH
jgi:hypothetical protein